MKAVLGRLHGTNLWGVPAFFIRSRCSKAPLAKTVCFLCKGVSACLFAGARLSAQRAARQSAGGDGSRSACLAWMGRNFRLVGMAPFAV